MESASNAKTYEKTLSSGYTMPAFGIGTYHMEDAKLIKSAISDVGYRMLDCASFYKNEELVG